MKQYSAILCDPPWSFRVWDKNTGHGRSAESHYSTMSLDRLKALDVQSLMAKDCALFMWVTWPTLPDALELGKAWGLTYKTCAFSWAKVNKRAVGRWVEVDEPANWFVGMGYWTRANTEPCLLFTKGSPKRKSKSVRQLVVSAIRRHSQKPDEVYGRIESLVDGPYLEMFARQNYAPQWDVWGNEVESDVALRWTDDGVESEAA